MYSITWLAETPQFIKKKGTSLEDANISILLQTNIAGTRLAPSGSSYPVQEDEGSLTLTIWNKTGQGHLCSPEHWHSCTLGCHIQTAS